MMNQAIADKFWAIVKSCLLDLYGMLEESADSEIARLGGHKRRKPGYRAARDIIFHSQPAHVAAEIAGHEGPMSEALWNRYRDILARHESLTEASSAPLKDVESVQGRVGVGAGKIYARG